ERRRRAIARRGARSKDHRESFRRAHRRKSSLGRIAGECAVMLSFSRHAGSACMDSSGQWGGGALGALLLGRWISLGRADNGCSRVFVLWWTGFWGVLDIMRVAGAEPIVPG